MIDPLTQFVAFTTIIATAVMAASASIQGVRHSLDLFGASLIGVATAVGGGTLRDLLLGRTPVFWINDLSYLGTAVPVAVVMYFIATSLPSGNGRRLRLLMQLDAIGLALFTLVGVRVALEVQTHAVIAVVIGCITGIVGGIIRDVLCNVTPSVLKEDLYATISLIGGAIYVVVAPLIGETVSFALCFVLMLVARLLLIRRFISSEG
ncbi:trimeric intracellular cation channel family protein [Shimia sp. MMG029]|uniref:trimeric intracellular cation channel family protein n=1 Tax=Shimia sp. MMG029 TaxID=3021978 RepID=UPI0022FDC981|nr:trimeric intracellular cation channel family protein [Shimia sp. MMG029]MDA5556652.1 trimeric intracellular cation channel family protein [Shimia sp. MMG029]